MKKTTTRKLKVNREILRAQLAEAVGGDARNSTHPSQCCALSVPVPAVRLLADKL